MYTDDVRSGAYLATIHFCTVSFPCLYIINGRVTVRKMCQTESFMYDNRVKRLLLWFRFLPYTERVSVPWYSVPSFGPGRLGVDTSKVPRETGDESTGGVLLSVSPVSHFEYT